MGLIKRIYQETEDYNDEDLQAYDYIMYQLAHGKAEPYRMTIGTEEQIEKDLRNNISHYDRLD